MTVTYKELDAMEAMFEGTADWTCTECFRPHAPSDYHCMCGQIKPNGREHILTLIEEVRTLKKNRDKNEHANISVSGL